MFTFLLLKLSLRILFLIGGILLSLHKTSIGTMSLSFFSFPLNLLLALIWALTIYGLWRRKRESVFVRYMLSARASITAIVLFIVFCLVVGLTGNRGIVSTWVFAVFMLYFLTVLAFVFLRGCRRGRWRFILIHLGLLLTLSSAFWGAPDSETLMVKAVKDEPVREAYSEDGRRTWLPYDVVLNDFSIQTYENGHPSMYEAEVVVGVDTVVLKVNHPYSRTFGEDVYLSGYDVDSLDDSRYCVIQIVKEPWKYWAVAGIIMVLAGAVMLFLRGPQNNLKEAK